MLSSLSPARRRMALLLAGVLTLAVLVAGVAGIAVARGRHSAASGRNAGTADVAGAAGTAGNATAPSSATHAIPGVGAGDSQASSATDAATTARSGSGTGTASTQAKPGPVLLVPGYGGSTGDLTALATTLRRHGRDAQVVALPGDGTGDLRIQAQSLGKAVDTALQRTGRSSVDLVGYSAGGVVARLYVRDDGGADKIRRVVTLGSPQHGTELAAAGAALPGLCPLACQQLIPDSDLLTQLNRGGETPRGPTFVSLWSDADETVVPPASARLQGSLGMSVQSICPTSTAAHADLPRDRLVTAIVVAELDGATTRQFSTGNCAQLSS